MTMANDSVKLPTNPRFIDITGIKFERLSVIDFSHSKNGRAYWKCKCDCGTIDSYQGKLLRCGHTKSCGCLKVDVIRNNSITHGMSSNSPEYISWREMKNRCHNQGSTSYENYGGRGIFVCDEWLNDFITFFNYVGKRPTKFHSIERVNNNIGYMPGNVKWATKKEQGRNKRNNVFITYNGIRLCISEWADITSINWKTLWMRRRRGWCDKCVIEVPVKNNGYNFHVCTHNQT